MVIKPILISTVVCYCHHYCHCPVMYHEWGSQPMCTDTGTAWDQILEFMRLIATKWSHLLSLATLILQEWMTLKWINIDIKAAWTGIEDQYCQQQAIFQKSSINRELTPLVAAHYWILWERKWCTHGHDPSNSILIFKVSSTTVASVFGILFSLHLKSVLLILQIISGEKLIIMVWTDMPKN